MGPASVREGARKARAAAQLALPLAVAAVGLPLIGRVYLALFEPAPGQGGWGLALTHIVQAAPAFLLLAALFGLVNVLREYEAGRFLSLAASAGLKRVGRDGLLAMILHFMVLPAVFAMLGGAPMLEALSGAPFNIAVMLFAAAVLSVGALLEAAAQALKADHDQIV